MKLHTIECGNLKLDGGAMFGVVPKSIWNKTNPADNHNLIDIATRSLLVEEGNRLILIDCGMGNKQSDKFFGYYHLWGDFSLDASLKEKGFHRDDITDVFFTHLHFDHCGGAIEYNQSKDMLQPAFKQAKFWTNQAHWKWATEPNAREKASFLKENICPIEESGQLNFLPLSGNNNTYTTPLGFDVITVDGHTEKQMLPKFKIGDKTLVYTADLIPTVGHIPLVYVMGYDTRPLLTLQEKADFLEKAAEENWFLCFEHDAHNQIATVKKTERGIKLDQLYSYEDILNE